MMTTMAALLGALAARARHRPGSELRRPLGVTIVGGLILSQLLTLYTTPVVYLYLERLRRWLGRRRERGPGGVDRGAGMTRGTLTMIRARTGWSLPLLLVLAGGLTACSGDRAESKQPPPRPVVAVAVAPVEQKAMPLQIQAIGTVEAYAVVSVRAQVGGELQRVHVKEGQQVRKGDLLFTIDPRTYEAALAQAEANVAKDQVQVQQARAVLERDVARIAQTKAALARDLAQSKNAQVQVERYADLYKRELIAQEQYDQIRTNAEALAATVRADEADVRSAEETVRADQAAIRSAEQTVRADEAAVTNTKIQLGYTTIRSPVDGRAGSLMLNEGNIVRAGGTSDSTLLVINQVKPIYVSFTVPQQQLPSIRRYMQEGTLGSVGGARRRSARRPPAS